MSTIRSLISFWNNSKSKLSSQSQQKTSKADKKEKKISKHPTPSMSSERLWETDLQTTVSIIGAPQSGVSSVSEAVNAAIKGKALPVDALLDRPDVFYEQRQYFGRMGSHVMNVDHRAAMMAKLAALIFVVNSADIASAFQIQWHKSNGSASPSEIRRRARFIEPVQIMSESEDWLTQMVGGRLDVLINKPILILCNKRDVPNAKTAEQIRDRLLSKPVPGTTIRLQECVATHNIGFEEGFQWLKQQINIAASKKSLGGRFLSSFKSSNNSSAELIPNIIISKLSECQGFSKLSESAEPSEVVKPMAKNANVPTLPASNFGFATIVNAAKVVV